MARKPSDREVNAIAPHLQFVIDNLKSIEEKIQKIKVSPTDKQFEMKLGNISKLLKLHNEYSEAYMDRIGMVKFIADMKKQESRLKSGSQVSSIAKILQDKDFLPETFKKLKALGLDIHMDEEDEEEDE